MLCIEVPWKHEGAEAICMQKNRGSGKLQSCIQCFSLWVDKGGRASYSEPKNRRGHGMLWHWEALQRERKREPEGGGQEGGRDKKDMWMYTEEAGNEFEKPCDSHIEKGLAVIWMLMFPQNLYVEILSHKGFVSEGRVFRRCLNHECGALSPGWD